MSDTVLGKRKLRGDRLLVPRSFTESSGKAKAGSNSGGKARAGSSSNPYYVEEEHSTVFDPVLLEPVPEKELVVLPCSHGFSVLTVVQSILNSIQDNVPVKCPLVTECQCDVPLKRVEDILQQFITLSLGNTLNADKEMLEKVKSDLVPVIQFLSKFLL